MTNMLLPLYQKIPFFPFNFLKSTILSLLFLITCNGCSTFYWHLSKGAVDYNLAVEESNNKLLLINAIRASKNLPLYFTGITVMRGNLSLSGTGAFSIPFGNNTLNPYNFNPSGTLSTNPNIEIKPLNTQEFYRGFAQQTENTLLKYYWDTGISKELLFYLFVEKLTIETKTTSVPKGKNKRYIEVIENDPDLSNYLTKDSKFRLQANFFIKCKTIKLSSTENKTNYKKAAIGIPLLLDNTDGKNLEHFINAENSGYKFIDAGTAGLLDSDKKNESAKKIWTAKNSFYCINLREKPKRSSFLIAIKIKRMRQKKSS